MHSLILFFAVALSAPAQILSFGVKAGVPVTRAPFDTTRPLLGSTAKQTGRWTVGPTVEVHITSALSIEIDALYRGYDLSGKGQFNLTADSPTTSYSYRHEVKTWDFPVLLKYRFLKGPMRPFINAGLSLTHESVDVTSTCSGPACLNPSIPAFAGRSTINSNRRGEVAGGGVEFKYGRIKIAPEMRYTRLSEPGGNQTTVMVGITF